MSSTCVTKSTIIWCMLTQIRSPTDIFALSPHDWLRKWKFGKNVKITWTYYPFTHRYHKSRSYDDVPEILSTTDRIFCHFGLFFPQTTRKIKILKKKKKTPGDIIISNMSTINKNHWCMIPGIWSTTDRIFSHSGPTSENTFFQCVLRCRIVLRWNERQCTVRAPKLCLGKKLYNQCFFWYSLLS